MFLGRGLLNQRVSKIVGLDEIPNCIGYLFFRQPQVFNKIQEIAKGTAQQNLSPVETAKLTQAMPSNKCITELARAFDGLHERLVAHVEESQSLAKLRDTLLPQLLSGELRIPDAEKLLAGSL